MSSFCFGYSGLAADEFVQGTCDIPQPLRVVGCKRVHVVAVKLGHFVERPAVGTVTGSP